MFNEIAPETVREVPLFAADDEAPPTTKDVPSLEDTWRSGDLDQYNAPVFDEELGGNATANIGRRITNVNQTNEGEDAAFDVETPNSSELE